MSSKKKDNGDNDNLAKQAKKDKIEAKGLAKEAKSLYKEQKKQRKNKSHTASKTELKEKLNPDDTQLDSKKVTRETRKKIKVKKPKAKDEKFDFKQTAREFPVKMIKEVNKIKWSGAENLTKKYVTVLVFMIVFAVIFFFADWGLQALFTLMKVI